MKKLNPNPDDTQRIIEWKTLWNAIVDIRENPTDENIVAANAAGALPVQIEDALEFAKSCEDE